jgi:RNA polymerase sigma factor (sigma-70 family)
MSDDELRARAGDEEFFAQLFERHATSVYNHCFRRTGSWATAEDLTSVVFLEAWKRRGQARAIEGTLLPWLLGVANNVVRNTRRALRRYDRLLGRLPLPAAEPDVADDIAGRLDDERAIQSVLLAMSRLSRDDQDVLHLCVWAGLSYEQAAVALGVPIGTVRSRLARARHRLRDQAGSAGGSHQRGTDRISRSGTGPRREG